MKLSLKLFEIAAQTYREHVARRSFIFFAFIAPLLCGLLFCGAAVWLTPLSSNSFTIGWVDESGLLSLTRAAPSARVRLQHFESTNAVEHAWRAGILDGYFVVPRDYLETGGVHQVARFEMAPFMRAYVERFLRAQLLEETAPDVRTRIVEGAFISHHALKPNDAPNWNRALDVLLAASITVLYLFLNQFTQNYLWHAVNAEHENRTIEILLTSVSLPEFFAGKVLGIALTGLTPFVVWGSIVGIPFAFAVQFAASWGIWFGAWDGWQMIVMAGLLLIPAYLAGALGIVLFGALTNHLTQFQPVPWFLDLLQALVFLPLMLIALVTPNSALAIALSILPWTAPIVLMLRLGLTDVPWWQIFVAIILQWAMVWLLLWLCARVYALARNGNVSWRAVLPFKT